MSKSRSKVHPSYKTMYRVENWAEYDRALVRRGDLTIWFSPEAIASWRPPVLRPTPRDLERTPPSQFRDHGELTA